MPVHPSPKNKGKFFQGDNFVVDDLADQPVALAIAVWLLSRPPEWEFSPESISIGMGIPIRRVRTGYQVLLDRGYLSGGQRSSGGSRWTYTPRHFHEAPLTPEGRLREIQQRVVKSRDRVAKTARGRASDRVAETARGSAPDVGSEKVLRKSTTARRQGKITTNTDEVTIPSSSVNGSTELDTPAPAPTGPTEGTRGANGPTSAEPTNDLFEALLAQQRNTGPEHAPEVQADLPEPLAKPKVEVAQPPDDGLTEVIPPDPPEPVRRPHEEDWEFRGRRDRHLREVARLITRRNEAAQPAGVVTG